MFEESKKQSLSRDPDNPDGEVKVRYQFRGLPVSDLIYYHDQIKALLPPLTLKEMDLESELLMQFHAIRGVQNLVLDDDDVPVNQRAQVANSVGTTLNRLAELQTSIYTSERFKRIENLLIRALRELPEDVASKFLEAYEKLLSQPRQAAR